MFKKLGVTALLTMSLVACDSGEENVVAKLATQLGAANAHPCAEQFDYQFELNGAADDTKTSSEEVTGETIFTESHWYADMQMVQFYTYSSTGGWCNNWQESGEDLWD